MNRQGVCTFCGDFGDVTDDHIPPKNLFPKPRPHLITVDACGECNLGSSKDDEYFKVNLALKGDTPEHDEGKKVYDSVIRGLKRKESSGLRNNLLNRTQEFDLVSAQGIYLGKGAGYSFNPDRMDLICAKIVKGLFYKTYDRRIGNEYKVLSYAVDCLNQVVPEAKEKLKSTLDILIEQELIRVGNVFLYSHFLIQDQNYMSIWLLGFYEQTYFVSFVVPQST